MLHHLIHISKGWVPVRSNHFYPVQEKSSVTTKRRCPAQRHMGVHSIFLLSLSSCIFDVLWLSSPSWLILLKWFLLLWVLLFIELLRPFFPAKVSLIQNIDRYCSSTFLSFLLTCSLSACFSCSCWFNCCDKILQGFRSAILQPFLWIVDPIPSRPRSFHISALLHFSLFPHIIFTHPLTSLVHPSCPHPLHPCETLSHLSQLVPQCYTAFCLISKKGQWQGRRDTGKPKWPG